MISRNFDGESRTSVKMRLSGLQAHQVGGLNQNRLD